MIRLAAGGEVSSFGFGGGVHAFSGGSAGGFGGPTSHFFLLGASLTFRGGLASTTSRRSNCCGAFNVPRRFRGAGGRHGAKQDVALIATAPRSTSHSDSSCGMAKGSFTRPSQPAWPIFRGETGRPRVCPSAHASAKNDQVRLLIGDSFIIWQRRP